MTDPDEKRVRIKGHPNCYMGDCDGECHVVSCAIHQGREEPEPEYEEEAVDETAG